MRKIPAPFTLCLLILLPLALAGPAMADEGRIPIYGPTTLSQPGHYVLTRDFCFGLSATPPCAVAVFGIYITSNDVTLDLNGRTLSTSQGQVLVEIATSTATRGIIIRNGRLVGGGPGAGSGNYGILATGTNPVQVVLKDLELLDLGGDVINLNSAQSVEIENCLIQGGLRGIQVLSGSGGFQGRISDNRLSGELYDGIWLEGMRGGEVARNTVQDFGSGQVNSAGIFLRDSSFSGEAGGTRVEGNTVSSGGRGSDDDGIVVSYSTASSSHNLIVDNVTTGNGRYGLWVATSENRIERNVASANGADGIHIGQSSVGSRNHLEGNQAQGNTGCGLSFTNGNAHSYRNNVFLNNAGGDVCLNGNPPPINGGGNLCVGSCP